MSLTFSLPDNDELLGLHERQNTGKTFSHPELPATYFDNVLNDLAWLGNGKRIQPSGKLSYRTTLTDLIEITDIKNRIKSEIQERLNTVPNKIVLLRQIIADFKSDYSEPYQEVQLTFDISDVRPTPMRDWEPEYLAYYSISNGFNATLQHFAHYILHKEGLTVAVKIQQVSSTIQRIATGAAMAYILPELEKELREMENPENLATNTNIQVEFSAVRPMQRKDIAELTGKLTSLLINYSFEKEIPETEWHLVYDGAYIFDTVVSDGISHYLQETTFHLNKENVLPFLRHFMEEYFRYWKQKFKENEDLLSSTNDWTCAEISYHSLLQRCYLIYDFALSDLEGICRSFGISPQQLELENWFLQNSFFTHFNSKEGEQIQDLPVNGDQVANSRTTLKWLGKPAHLAFLFDLLVEKGFIEATPYGETNAETLLAVFTFANAKPTKKSLGSLLQKLKNDIEVWGNADTVQRIRNAIPNRKDIK